VKGGSMEKKISAGIILIAWFYLLMGLGGIVGIVTLKSKLAAYPITLPNSSYYVVQCYQVIGSIAYLVSAIGLLRTLKWARMFTIVITVLFSLIYNNIHFLFYARPYIIPYFVKMNKPVTIIYAFYIMGYIQLLLFIYYLTRPKVKKQFK
jgi:hypothetical protein